MWGPDSRDRREGWRKPVLGEADPTPLLLSEEDSVSKQERKELEKKVRKAIKKVALRLRRPLREEPSVWNALLAAYVAGAVACAKRIRRFQRPLRG